MKAIAIPNGILHISESKAECPYCTYKFEFEDFEKQWMKSNSSIIRKKCKCKRFVGVTQTIRGDFVAFELNKKS